MKNLTQSQLISKLTKEPFNYCEELTGVKFEDILKEGSFSFEKLEEIEKEGAFIPGSLKKYDSKKNIEKDIKELFELIKARALPLEL